MIINNIDYDINPEDGKLTINEVIYLLEGLTCKTPIPELSEEDKKNTINIYNKNIISGMHIMNEGINRTIKDLLTLLK
jgi:hypothetical protein